MSTLPVYQTACRFYPDVVVATDGQPGGSVVVVVDPSEAHAMEVEVVSEGGVVSVGVVSLGGVVGGVVVEEEVVVVSDGGEAVVDVVVSAVGDPEVTGGLEPGRVVEVDGGDGLWAGTVEPGTSEPGGGADSEGTGPALGTTNGVAGVAGVGTG